MSLLDQLERDYKNALKAKNDFATSALRMLRASLKNAEIAKRPSPLTDEDAQKVLKSELKKLHDALVDFEKGKRDDLIAKTKKETEFIKQYLPEEMGEEAIELIVRRVIDIMKPSGPGDFGRVMGATMKEVAGRASGDAVGKVVRKLL